MPKASHHLSESLEAGGVFHDVPGRDLTSILRETVARCSLRQDCDREFLLKLFMARESLGSTAIGDGIAVPHIRLPRFLGGENTRPNMVAMAYSRDPVPYDTPDGKPLSIIICVVSSSVTRSFRIFRHLSHALRDASFRRTMMEKQPTAEILRQARRVEKEIHDGEAVQQMLKASDWDPAA